MGRSKGGLTTKIYALVDANDLPILLKITPGQAADMFDTLTKGDVLLADRAYESDGLRTEMEARGVFANVRLIPQRVRKPPFSASLYKLRNVIERFFSKIKHYRAIATRYEKYPENYLALIKLASVQIWMKFISR